MRLIDADILLGAMDERYKEKKDIVPDNLAEGFFQMEKLIKEQPTAYDKDKVVEELEKWSAEVAVISEVDGKIHRVKVVNAGRAIDIAREGGVE